jgi:hypothetical protein
MTIRSFATVGAKRAWLFLLILIAGVLSIVFFQFTVDDAYITFRHSLNLASEGILSWNTEGPREEAFTNPLYVLLGTIGLLLGVKPELPIKLLGATIFLVWIWRANQIARPATTAKKLILSTVFLLCIPAYIHAYSGLETFAFAYLLFEFLACDQIGSPRGVSIGCLLLLCRPEGVLFLVAAGSTYLKRVFTNPASDEAKRSRWHYPMAAIITITVLVFGYKITYFGDLLPNTFYAKSGTPFNAQGVLANLASSMPWVLLAALTFNPNEIVRKNALKYGSFAIIYIVYVRSSLAMNYANRFWFQLFWPMIIYSTASNNRMDSFASLLGFHGGFNYVSLRAGAMSALSFFWIAGNTLITNPSEIMFLATYFGRAIRSHANLGLALNQILPHDATIFVGDAGLIPYHARRMTYDPLALGTKEIAKKGITEEFLKRVKPDVFILHASTCTDEATSGTYYAWDKEVAYIKANGYRYLGGFIAGKNYCMNIYSKPEIAARFSDRHFINAQQNSLINDREGAPGFLSDLKHSYTWLFSSDPPISKASSSSMGTIQENPPRPLR